jgi:uncharacterized protein VirK/YbjX
MLFLKSIFKFKRNNLKKIFQNLLSLLKIKDFSVLFLAINFAQNGYENFEKSYINKQKWKIVFHTILNLSFAKKWFAFLNSENFKYVTKNRPRIYIKPFRPYISTKWNKARKVKVIADNYRFIRTKGEKFSEILTSEKGLILSTILFENKFEANLKLGYEERYRKEGELVLWLECEEFGGKVISIAFSIEEVDKKWICLVGCVQGLVKENSKNSFRSAQKSMFGIRPNTFIVFALQELIRFLECDQILCTGYKIQAFRKKHAIHLPWIHEINFDYDKFWIEVGAISIDNNWFELPLKSVRKLNENIPSHKRNMYRNRYVMLDKISENIENFVEGLK